MRTTLAKENYCLCSFTEHHVIQATVGTVFVGDVYSNIKTDSVGVD